MDGPELIRNQDGWAHARDKGWTTSGRDSHRDWAYHPAQQVDWENQALHHLERSLRFRA